MIVNIRQMCNISEAHHAKVRSIAVHSAIVHSTLGLVFQDLQNTRYCGKMT